MHKVMRITKLIDIYNNLHLKKNLIEILKKKLK